jgi:hypothetical protein
MRRRGMIREEIEAALLEVNKRCVPPLDESEVKGIAASIAQYPPGAAPAGGGSPGARQRAAQIIADHLRLRYWPVFKSGPAIYSAKEGRPVPANEALRGAPSDLIDLLADAADGQRGDDGKVLYGKRPALFRTWAPTAWQDVWGTLQTEEEAPEVDPEAEAGFRRQVRAALLSELPLGRDVKEGKETVTRVERRSVADWCNIFARPGRWGDIRGRQCWCMRDPGGRLRVVIRLDLFGQVGSGALAALSERKFNELGKRYGVVTEDGVKVTMPGGKQGRAIELHADFVAELLAEPEQPADTRTQGRGDMECAT